MKAPSVAPITAIQVFAEIAGVAAAGAAFNSPVLAAEAALMVGWSVVMRSPLARAEAGCIRRLASIIVEVREGLSGQAG